MNKVEKPLKVLSIRLVRKLQTTPLELQRMWEARGYKVHFDKVDLAN